MNRYAMASIGGLLLVVCATTVFAQEQQKRKHFDHTADIVTEYNKDKDETKVELKQIKIVGAKVNDEHILNLTAYFIYSGKTPAKPAEVVFGLVSASYNRERKFQDFRELKAQVDGKQESLGTMELIDSRMVSRYYKELLGIFLPWEVFERLIAGKKESLEMSVGNVRFALERVHLEALRDLASRIE